MGSHEAVDAVERIGRDAPAVAQPRGELAVVDGAAAEREFGQPRSGGNNPKFPVAVAGRSWHAILKVSSTGAPISGLFYAHGF